MIRWEGGGDRMPCAFTDFCKSDFEHVSHEEWDSLCKKDPRLMDYVLSSATWKDSTSASPDEVVAITTCGRPSFVSCSQAANAIKSCVVFSEELLRLLGSVEIRPHTVGIHIRRTDHALAIATSRTELFIAEMEKGVFYFVCSDDPTEIERLRATGMNIQTTGFPIGRRNCQMALCGLAEMILLSKCRTILGSRGSTFSSFASCYGDVLLRVVGGRP
jgi:hypothetical protein